MPQNGKRKAVPSPGRGPRTPQQQYEVEQRIWTDISNALYEVGARVAEWIKEGGEKQDKRILAAMGGIKAYTTAYITAEKERVRGTEIEERRATRVTGMLTSRAQEPSDALGMTDAPQTGTYAETATQTGEEWALDEIMESDAPQSHTYAETSTQTEESIYTEEDMEEVVGEIGSTVKAKLEIFASTLEGKMETMKQEYEAEVECLKERAATSPHTYMGSATQTEESWALDEMTALPEEIPTRKEEGRESYA